MPQAGESALMRKFCEDIIYTIAREVRIKRYKKAGDSSPGDPQGNETQRVLSISISDLFLSTKMLKC